MKSIRNLVTDVLTLAGAYTAHTGLAESTVSTMALNDGKRLRVYREGTPNGRQAYITPDRFLSALTWFSENWPTDLEWPAEIERPAAETASKGAA
ncbi:hypothetical protein A9320_24780 [Ruegeria sp. PBVC088]|nr:hypothetical protein A9320_24780 [Ruegeria sp. PBVC088]